MSLQAALARTLLLMRDEVNPSVRDDTLVAALTGTRVALIADNTNIASHAAQSSFVTAAMLMARSGHEVHLVAPNVPLVGAQPPLGPGGMITELLATGVDLLPGLTFRVGMPDNLVDLAVALGDTAIKVPARRTVRLNADAWSGSIVPADDASPFGAQWWPIGGMGAGTLVASEAFKLAMRKIGLDFRNPERLHTVFGPSDRMTFATAPASTPYAWDLGSFDCVSGGAIMHAVFYALARIPIVSGQARVIEPDSGDVTNLNRYMLLRRSHLGQRKASDLAAELNDTGLATTPFNSRFKKSTLATIAPLASRVLVGVDDIPSRWLAQRQDPGWLAVGATSHWSAMASFHEAGLGCAHCLHWKDEPGNGPIPTVAFVSFCAGLLTASYFLRQAAGRPAKPDEQQVFMTPFWAQNSIRSPVPFREHCPTCGAAAAVRQARQVA
jgi:hypothetical protein